MSIIAAIMVPHPPLIIPAIGQGEEKRIQKTVDAYQKASRLIMEAKPDTIVITSPHSILYSDYFHISPGQCAAGDFGRFAAKEIRITAEYDSELVTELSRLCAQNGPAAGTLGEREQALDHATLVPLYFLQQSNNGQLPSKIVRIGLSGQPLTEHYRLGQQIARAAERLGRRVALIASGDLSHKLKQDGPYGFAAEGPLYDERIMRVMRQGDFAELFEFEETFCEKAAECGHRSFVIMAGAFDGFAVRAEQLSYEGPFGVGYGVCSFLPLARDENRHFLDAYLQKTERKLQKAKAAEDAYVHLARQTLEAYLLHHTIPPIPSDLPAEMLHTRAAVFVSLHKNGQLRGCIGTITPTTDSVAQEIIQNAISAATRDPRFHAVDATELAELEYSVDVLSPAEKITSAQELDVKRYGVIVQSGHQLGLLLPNLDGVDSVEEQIAIAKRKAGITEKQAVSLQRFEVVRHV
ncbi:MAG: AmmeMemoRadiSam system protein A [Negativicutes bacterium]|nr:AmmeMemoRadiSam system protein A [Negativicutes bacterium]